MSNMRIYTFIYFQKYYKTKLFTFFFFFQAYLCLFNIIIEALFIVAVRYSVIISILKKCSINYINNF